MRGCECHALNAEMSKRTRARREACTRRRLASGLAIASPLRYKNNDAHEHSRQRNPDVSSWRRRRLIRRLKGISSGTEKRPKDASLCLTINHPLFSADRG
ncbi:uncharacterized [Tachysurus ichikawai]